MTVKTGDSNKKSHRWTQQHLSDYIDHELSEKQKVRLETHLADCSECAHDLRAMRQTVEWLHQLSEQPLPKSFMLSKAQVTASEPKWDWLFPYFRAGAIAATLLLIIVLSADIFQSMLATGQLAQAPVEYMSQATQLPPEEPVQEPDSRPDISTAKTGISEEGEKAPARAEESLQQEEIALPTFGGLVSPAEKPVFTTTNALEAREEMVDKQQIAPEQPPITKEIQDEANAPLSEAEPDWEGLEFEVEARSTLTDGEVAIRNRPALPSPTAIALSEAQDRDISYENRNVSQVVWRIVELGLAGFVMISLIAMWLLRRKASKR